MNTEQFDQDLLSLTVPNFAPGAHMEVLAKRLSPQWGTSRRKPSPRRRFALFAALTAASLMAAAAGIQTYRRYVFTTTSAWAENEFSDGFSEFDPAHRDEARALWKAGQVTPLETKTTPEGLTVYVVRFDFRDGTSVTARMGDPANPAMRAEWRETRDAGGGELVSLRRLPNGSVMYLVRYTLSNGEAFQTLDSFPPMSKAERSAALDYVTPQIDSGAGAIVGSTGHKLVVEFVLPDGHAYTHVVEQPYPRPQLTPERQDEISQMIALGQGEFEGQFFSQQGSVYIVNYTLADGSVFRVGGQRPVMADAQWSAACAEAPALYAAGRYTRETVTAIDGQPVEVLVMTLSTGYVAKIRDVPSARQLWGIE